MAWEKTHEEYVVTQPGTYYVIIGNGDVSGYRYVTSPSVTVPAPEEIKYTLPSIIRFDNDFNPQNLKNAIIQTVEAHPYLKTRIVTDEDGNLKQKKCNDVPIDEIPIVNVKSITADEIMKNVDKSILKKLNIVEKM